jgi:myo-inositol-1(or 4)-monophosphatase
MQTKSPLVNVIINAIAKASRGLLRDFGEIEHLQVSRKGLGDFVSIADHRSEEVLIRELKRARPDYSVLSEEAGFIKGSDPDSLWIIDPLDGTSNFLHGIPHFSISIALKKKNDIVAGVTYDPVKDEFFWSEKGMGVFLNLRRVRVSGRSLLEEALIGLGAPFGKKGDPKRFAQQVSNILPVSAGIRRMGVASLDLAYVASGRFDVFFEENCKPWDIAAGILFVSEAGGTVTELDGGNSMLESGSILAANAVFHQNIRSLLI